MGETMNEKKRIVKSTDEWVPDLVDSYYAKLRDDLIKAGIPEFIATPAMIKAEKEDSAKKAYV
jgi:hypothetical protein